MHSTQVWKKFVGNFSKTNTKPQIFRFDKKAAKPNLEFCNCKAIFTHCPQFFKEETR
jgi:hypothetical protein